MLSLNLPISRPLAVLLFFLTSAARVAAQSTGTIESLTFTGATLDVIASDAGTGNGRDVVPLSVDCTMTRTLGGAATQTFGMQVQILDETTLPGVPIILTGGRDTVSIGTVTIPFGFSGNFATRTFAGSIAPREPMLTSRRYRVSATLVRDPANTAVPLANKQSKRTLWWHWTSQASNDTALNVLGAMESGGLRNPVIITSQPGQSAWTVDYAARLRRYDGFSAAPVTDTVQATLSWRLLDVTTGNTPVALTVSSLPLTQPLASHDGGTPPQPVDATVQGNFTVSPVSFASIHPLHDYAVEVTLQHQDGTGGSMLDDVFTSLPARMLRLNGTLVAGPATTSFNQIANNPGIVPGASVSGSTFTTQMIIPEGAGTWPQMPGYTFGSSTPVPVAINLNTGVTTLLGGSLYIASPSGDGGVVNNVRLVRSNPLLGDQGFAAEEIDVLFPAGFGIGLTSTSRRLQSRYTLYNPLLTPLLTPSAGTFSIPCAYAAHERAPLRCTGGSVTWNVMAGTFSIPNGGVDFERKAELDRLEAAAPLLADATDVQRRANDGWFRQAGSTTLTVRADAVGIAGLEGSVQVNAGANRPHFPAGPVITWSSAGSYQWSAASPLGAGTLPGAGPVALSHARAVPGDPCTANAPQGVINFTPGASSWVLGANGTVRQEGTVTSGNIIWGARPDGSNGWTLRNFTAAAFMTPGYIFPIKQEYGGRTAAALLLTGTGRPGNATYAEEPTSTAYQNTGDADYAGINVRASQNAGAAATQLIGAAGSPVAYGLKPCSKYYIRAAGVSGRHEALPNAVGSVPLWGFTTTFHELAVSLLDLRVHDSRTRAALRIGGPSGPSDFLVELERVKFGPGGELRDAAISPLTPPVHLTYWGANITPLTCLFRFTQPGGPQSCQNLDSGFPVLGVSCQTTHLQEGLTGNLGFTTNGNLIPASAAIAAGTGVDSRLRVPSQLNVKSIDPGKSFALTPVTGAAFNDWAAADRPEEGFLSFAGKLNVPFFDDIPVHVHLSPSRANGVYLMGPFTDAAGRTAFADTGFDSGNRGLPPGVNVADYRSPAANTSPWHPRARREWKGLLFDYPVHWEPLRRQFAAKGTALSNIFVLELPSELRTLSATTVDIGFGVRLGEMPNINTQQLVADIREGFNHIAGSMRNAMSPEFDPADIVDGFGAIDELLNVNPSDMLDPVLDRILGPTVLDAMYLQVQSAYTGAGSDLSDLCARLENGTAAGQDSFKALVIARCQQLTDITTAGNAWAQTIIDRINRIDIAVRTVRHIVEKSGTPAKRQAARLLVQELMRNQSGLLHDVVVAAGGALDGLVLEELEGSEKTFAWVEEVLTGLHNRLLVLRGQVEIGQGFLIRLQEQVQLAQADLVNGPIATIAQRTVMDVCAYLQSQLDPGRTLLVDRPDEIRARIKGWIKEHFIAQVFAAEIRTAIRRAAGEVRETLRDGMDAIFGEANRMIDKVILRAQAQFTQLAALAAQIDSTIRGFTNLDSLGAGEVKGQARISGDQLEELRIDAAFKVKKPTELSFRGWLLARSLQSQTPGTVCHAAGANGVEITIGGAAPLEGLGFSEQPNQTNAPKAAPEARFQLAFALDVNNSPLGLDGRFDLTGPVKFKHIEANDVSLGFGGGSGMLYLYGKASGKVWGQETNVALFLGKHCNIPSLQIMDPRVQGVIERNLNRAPGTISDLAGFYIYGENWTSLNELFHIPDTCLFSAKIKGGTGYFGLAGNAPGGGPGQMTIGAVLNYAAKAKILCLVTGEGDLLLVPALSFLNYGALADFDVMTAFNSLTLSADAFLTIKATLGYCPFCTHYSDSFHLRATLSPTDGVDVDLD